MHQQSAANSSTSATTILWQTRVAGILNSTDVFFANNIMNEVACEANGKCDVDQRSFKAHLSRWLAATAKVAPFTRSIVYSLLSSSATAAAKTCTAGNDGNQCGLRWTLEANDGSLGVGEQMSALEVFQGLLVDNVAGPVTNKTGGTSVGNSAAGTGAGTGESATQFDIISSGDRAGAGILTTVVLLTLFAGAGWILKSDT
jgi:mannan endo-1,6-alpha-mannosidase